MLSAAVGCSGKGSNASPSHGPSASATTAAHSSGPPSAGAARGLLYTGKSATFSNSWAVEHGCPVDLAIDITDHGPQLRDPDSGGDGKDANDQPWPGLKWSPPCSGMAQQIDFDGNPVAKVTGTPTQSTCRSEAEKSRRDGTALDAYSPSALTAGDEFCEYDKSRGRVILLRVTSLSVHAPSQIAWAVTEWAVAPPSGAIPAAGAVLYADQAFTLNESMSKAQNCVPAAVNLRYQDGPDVHYGSNETDGDLVYFPACLGEAKIRFGDYVAQVNGTVGAAACESAAAGSGQNSLDVDLSALHPGSEYCEYDSESEAVVLVKVVSVTTSPALREFSASAWKARSGQ